MSKAPMLVRLDDSDLTLAEPADDVRGLNAVDENDDEVGGVDGLVVDDEERRVRFLVIGFGGFLGMGKQEVLVPVDAVTDVGDVVRVCTDRDRLAGSPAYDPELVLDQTTAAGYYDYFGYAPYWSAGYIPPGFPYRPR